MPRSSELEQRLAFLDLTPSDLEQLEQLRPILEQKAPAFVGAFYRHLLSFPQTRRLLADPGVKERLLKKQEEYLVSLADPTIDDAYLAQRRKIGEVHDEVGLEPRWYLGAYALYLSVLIPTVCETYEHDPHKAISALIALQKRLFLDAQLAIDTYMARHTSQLQYLTEELAKQGRMLARDYEDQKVELRQTESRARAAEELASVATLVAGLAHEIGTPMGVIQGHARLLESAVSGEDATWRLRTIQEQIGRISKIIQTLLDMARPRKTRRMPVVLEPLLETSLSFLSEKLARRNVRLKTRFDPVSSILGDAERLQQLFLNLVLNGIDAMPEGGELRVSLVQRDAKSVEIRVADTGMGISAEALEHIFEPFFTTKPSGEGNGLGLMVAKGIVGDHGASIDVTSTEGKGTQFVIRFPVPETAVDAKGLARV